MRGATQMMGRALVGALVLAWMATAGWSQSLTWLGTLGGGGSGAYAVSADGSVVVGGARNAVGQWLAFRWQNGVMQDLGTLGGDESEAYGVSADGSVVVGRARNAVGDWHAFRWQNGVMQDLGTLGGSSSGAYGVSTDGSVVVGGALNAAVRDRAFRWTASGGMEDLNTTYASLLTNGSRLWVARAISSNGRYIVGTGYNAATNRNEAFLLDTGPRCTAHNGDVDNNGCVDDADLLAVLFAFGNTGSNLGREDTNCDGVVDDADLLTVLFNFGSGC
jgi:probable HAF family extracellular repeat protein